MGEAFRSGTASSAPKAGGCLIKRPFRKEFYLSTDWLRHPLQLTQRSTSEPFSKNGVPAWFPNSPELYAKDPYEFIVVICKLRFSLPNQLWSAITLIAFVETSGIGAADWKRRRHNRLPSLFLFFVSPSYNFRFNIWRGHFHAFSWTGAWICYMRTRSTVGGGDGSCAYSESRFLVCVDVFLPSFRSLPIATELIWEVVNLFYLFKA